MYSNGSYLGNANYSSQIALPDFLKIQANLLDYNT